MKLDRMLGILNILLQNDRVTAPYLAEKFEVNRRTIGRDIDALCQAGIPIVTHQGTGGGISIAEGFKLDKSILTTDELSGIIAALKGIGSVSEQSRIERILDKLGANADAALSFGEPVVIDLKDSHYERLTEKIATIKHAILHRQPIAFDYFYEKGKTHRQIEPYLVVFQWGSWYVFGFCFQRQDWRMFKLARLWNLAPQEGTYTPREIPAEKQEFDNFFTDKINLVALIDPSERHQLIEIYGMDAYIETAEGLLFEMSFTNRQYLLSWLLGFGGRVRVLEPKDLAADIKAAAEQIVSLYP